MNVFVRMRNSHALRFVGDRPRVELLASAHGLQQRVLDEVLGFGGIPRELARDAVESIEVGDGVLGEGIDFFGFQAHADRESPS